MTSTPDNDRLGLRPPPWEERDRYGTLNALVATIRQVFVAPRRLFSRMPVGLGILQPLLFAALLGLIGALFDWMWSLASGDLPFVLSPEADRLFHGPWLTGASFVLSPITVVVMVFLRATVFHGLLTLMGGNRLGFEATFRVVAYSRATRLLSILPLCGGFVGLVWELAVTVIGLARIHECADWKAIVAVLAPVLLALMLFGRGIMVLLGLAALQ